MTKPLTILHADDSPRFRELVSKSLTDDYRVMSVGSCDAALVALREGGIALVILDHLMPGSDEIDTGFEVCQHIRREYPELPVVIFTGAWEGVAVNRVELETKFGARMVFKWEGISALKQVVAELLTTAHA